jgi:hypothetical protein
MKSIKRNFESVREKRPAWSSYACFVGAVKGKRFGKEAIRRWFNKLVEKDDYAKSDKKALLENLERLSNPMRTPENQGKTRQG